MTSVEDAADPPAPRSRGSSDDRTFGLPVTAALAILLTLHLGGAVAAVAGANDRVDEVIARYDRVATSPVRPYLYFPVEWMPVQTGLVLLMGGGGTAATAAKVAGVAFVAQAAVAAALAYGWGRRRAAIGLLIGLPIVAVSSARIDLVAVALAAWAFALARRRLDGAAGATLAVGILSGFWVVLLAPFALIGRRPIFAWLGAAVLVVGGAGWFLYGGPDGPMQVLSYRGATGWDVQSTIGAVLDASTSMATFVEGGIERIGYASPLARGAILAVVVITTLFAWWRHRRPGADPAGVALTVTAAALAVSPTFDPVWVAWLVPWAAVVAGGDRGRAGAAWLAVVLTGVIVVVGGEDGRSVTAWLVLARAGILLGVALAGLRRPPAPADAASEREPGPAALTPGTTEGWAEG